jgi:pimeloyl-ACP methyl ester carboxylesterase
MKLHTLAGLASCIVVLSLAPNQAEAKKRPQKINAKTCVTDQLQRLFADLQVRNLRNAYEPNYLDEQLEAARARASVTGKFEIPEAPGEFYQLKMTESNFRKIYHEGKSPLEGKNIHYMNLKPETDGPQKGTIVLIGGLLYHGRQWNDSGFVDKFRANGYRVLVIDPPGQGHTLLDHVLRDGKPLSRYDKHDQAVAIKELLDHLRSQGVLGEGPLHLAGESYGGWLSIYLSTLKEFAGVFKNVFPLDPGIANTALIPPGVSQFEYFVDDVKTVYNPNVVDRTMKPIFNLIEIGKKFKFLDDFKNRAISIMKKSPFSNQVFWGHLIEGLGDGKNTLMMDLAVRSHGERKSPLLYSGAPPMFNGIRDFDAAEYADFVHTDTHLFEAGQNGGIVPHSQHGDYAKKNPRLKTWLSMKNTGHDLPVHIGSDLAEMMISIIEGRVHDVPTSKKIVVDPSQGNVVEQIQRHMPPKPAPAEK